MERVKVIVDCGAPQGRVGQEPQDALVLPLAPDELTDADARAAAFVASVAAAAAKATARDADIAVMRAAAVKDPTFAALARLLGI